ncbi:transcriptional repressor [Nonomuraea sp. NPDC050153]|uniref:transcriptional repressor n=1 Tax=Nonomuraea sp. NPDC050153 TaxID=3364359 RepID=UPI003787826D
MRAELRDAGAHPMVNLSTVYWNVTVMSEYGVPHSIEHGGETLFCLATTPHHHLACERCRRCRHAAHDAS